MSEAAVIGHGPIMLNTKDGQQLSIPLTSLYFDSSGALKTDRWPPHATAKIAEVVDPWLGYLVKTGRLTPSPQAPPTTAMVITAADPGPAGNNIQITFSNVTPDPANPNDPSKTTFDALVVETDTYAGLSFDSTKPNAPNYIKNVLGTETLSGSRPGLVHVLDADPPASKPMAKDYPLAGGGAAAKSKVAVDGDPSGTAFNLEAKKVGAGGDKIKVTISSVDNTAKTFTLVAVWSSQPITAIKPATAKAQLEQNKYEIEVTPSGSNTPPVAGVVSLTGGAGAKAASAATATVYSG